MARIYHDGNSLLRNRSKSRTRKIEQQRKSRRFCSPRPQIHSRTPVRDVSRVNPAAINHRLVVQERHCAAIFANVSLVATYPRARGRCFHLRTTRAHPKEPLGTAVARAKKRFHLVVYPTTTFQDHSWFRLFAVAGFSPAIPAA